jgi:hypothetical protein
MTNDVHLWILLLTFVVAYAIYWYTRPPNANDFPIESKSVEDPFLQQIASAKTHRDTTVSAARRQHERELEERFANDIQLKQRLSQFAKDMELDEALIALWEEIKNYPTWATMDDFPKERWNKLHLTGISGTTEGDTESVEFLHGTQHFKVAKRTSGYEPELVADFSLWENNEEVFAISCSVQFNEAYDKVFSYPSVSAFKKQGNWAKVLLQYYEKIQIEQAKVAGIKYWGADEIKSRFKE